MPYPAAAEFDRAQPFRIVRDRERVLLPTPGARAAVRKRYGLPEAAPVVLGVSRLVPRKGFDVLIDAVARLARRSFPAAGASDEPVHLALGGSGRDRGRLAARAAGAGLGH